LAGTSMDSQMQPAGRSWKPSALTCGGNDACGFAAGDEEQSPEKLKARLPLLVRLLFDVLVPKQRSYIRARRVHVLTRTRLTSGCHPPQAGHGHLRCLYAGEFARAGLKI